MRHKLILILSFSACASSAIADTRPAPYAEPASREETTGLIGGALLGAIAGGPPGAIIGAALGAVGGDGIHSRRQLDSLRTDLLTAQLERERIEEEALVLQQRYELVQAELALLQTPAATAMPVAMSGEPSAFCCDLPTMILHFRSGSADIEEHYATPLRDLAHLAMSNPQLTINLSGHADRSGEAEDNLTLARQRTTAVERYLIDLGIESANINSVAFGESRPLHESQGLETDFFDRRVTILLRDPSEQMLSQSANER